MEKDVLHGFIFTNDPVRGQWVHLDTSWQHLLDIADYPETIQHLLGEALAAVVLLSATIKHQGAVILQIRGNGPISLLVVQATSEGKVRGLAHWQEEPDGQTLPELFGSGHIAITLEPGSDKQERYQGVIALEGDTLSTALEAYFTQSEQLPTRLHLFADNQCAAGVLLQSLPLPEQTSETEHDQHKENWRRLTFLMETINNHELKNLSANDLLYRLFHEESVRLLEAKRIDFSCSCNQERIEKMVLSLGQEEAESILDEQKQIGVTCEFCNRQYQLDNVDVKRIFTANVIDNGNHEKNHTLH